MPRREIGSAVVEETERMFAQGADQATIAAHVGITEYVVSVIASMRGRAGGSPRPRRSTHRVPNSQRCVDATTIRMIQRMIASGMSSHIEIARETGVSVNTVSDVATGKRTAVTLCRPVLNPGETFLHQPTRCRGCGAMLSVAPCRACLVNWEKNSV